MLKIWGRANSSNLKKVTWLCEEIGLAYERIDAGMSFGVVNTPEYRKLNPNELVFTCEMLRRARRSELEVFALDYAFTPELRRAAQVRARAQGLSTFISVRELNAI